MDELNTIIPEARATDLQVEFVAAKNEGASKEVEFKTKSLNIWTDAPKVWIQDDVWMRSGARPAEWETFGIGRRAA